MFKKLRLICLTFLFINYFLNAKFLQQSILSHDTFSLELKCVLPMLGSSLAEFEVSKNTHVLAKFDIEKNFKDYGIPFNSQTNPENIKFIFVVYRLDLTKAGLFWSNTNGETFLTKPSSDFVEIITSCGLWIKDITKISNDFDNSKSAPLTRGEDKFGNKKFSFKNTVEDVEYGYIFQDDNLTALTQIRDPGAGLLANIIAFVNSSKVLEFKEMMPIPEGVVYDEL